MSFGSAKDISWLTWRLLSEAKRNNMLTTSLGTVNERHIHFFSPSVSDPDKPKVLVISGHHGDEPAGPLSILDFMCGFNFALSPVEFSFIPVINPTGMQLGTRLNVFGQDPNRGYIHNYKTKDNMSVEGHLIVNNLESIIRSRPDCVISLHEDCDEDEFYLYSSDAGRKSLTVQILKALSKVSKIKNGQIKENNQIHSVVDGRIGNCCDGSIEDLLFHCGVKHVITTETPGLLNIENRIDINCEILSTVSCLL